MRVHFIGHASLLIETADQKILMDPVFWDPHLDGLCAVSPERVVHTERLPDYTLVVVSHRHLDHFDIRTLSSLDRGRPVIIPAGDPALAYGFERLGFGQVTAVEPGQMLTFGETRLLFTDSEAPVQEFGLMAADSTGAVWNQVDSIVSPEIIGDAVARLGKPDLLIAPWQPLLELGVAHNHSTSFPLDAYFHNLETVKLLQPRALVPGSCGFKYVGGSAWLNRFVFPTTREQFLRDASRLAPGAEGLTANPGDVIEVTKDDVRLTPGGSAFVEMVRDDSSETAYDPTHAIPESTDENPNGYPEEEMLAAVGAFLRQVASVVEDSIRRESLFDEFRKVGAVLQLEVFFPSGPRAWWLDFAGTPVEPREGRHPTANIFWKTPASVLVDLIMSRRTSEYASLGGYYRWFHRLYEVDEDGFRPWTPAGLGSVPDPLTLAFSEDDLLTKHIDREALLYNAAGAD